MHKAVLLLATFALAGATDQESSAAGRVRPSRACYSVSKPGDLVLGGLFTISGNSTNGQCQKGTGWASVLKTAVAMGFAVEEINDRADLLSNVSLGYDIRDDCYSEELSLWQTLALISPGSSNNFKDHCSLETPRTEKVVGLIGTSRSETTAPATNLGNIFDVPVISYGASSDQFSDREKFAYLLRTFAPDRLRVEAIFDILGYFEWVYVALLYSADNEGIHGVMQFEAMAAKRNVCLAFSSFVRESTSQEDRDEIVTKLMQLDKAAIVVTFLSQSDALNILQSFRQAGVKHRHIWITAQVWYRKLTNKDLDEVISGGIFLEVKNEPVPEFKDYVGSLTQTLWPDHTRWFREAFTKYMTLRNCSSLLQCTLLAPEAGEATPVINAVRAFAYALDAYINELCADKSDCSYKDYIEGSHLLSLLKNVNFPTAGGNFSFNKFGDAGGRYTINNFQPVNGKYRMVEVGTWSSSGMGLVLNETLMRWQNGSSVIPRSNCREQCAAGSFSVAKMEKCCYGCRSCPQNAIIQGTECVTCKLVEWPNEDHTRCIPIAPTPINFTSPAVISILTLSGLGIVFCVLTAVTGLVLYRNHPLIKASSRELSSINVLGLASAFVTAVLILLPPSACTCIVAETGLAFSFTLSFSTTLLKVVRIYRIFQAGKRSVRRPRFVTPRAQLIMVSIIVVIQMLIITTSILASPSKPETVSHGNPGEKHIVQVFCRLGAGFYGTAIYNLLLVVGCCWAAFKTRKVPSNYNESKFIAVSVYSTLVLCLAAVPVYTTAVAVLQKVGTLCLMVQLNAVLTLVFVYLPKLYAIRFMSEPELAVSAGQTQFSKGPSGSPNRKPRIVDVIRVHPISSPLPSVHSVQ